MGKAHVLDSKGGQAPAIKTCNIYPLGCEGSPQDSGYFTGVAALLCVNIYGGGCGVICRTASTLHGRQRKDAGAVPAQGDGP